MKYIINLSVTFDPDNRILTLKNDSQHAVELSKPATRLLSELINNNRTNLAREDILKNVWEDYGFSPSNASLNNHISELRKAFISLGMTKDVIFTVPRIGLRMDAEIHPEPPVTREVSSPLKVLDDPSEVFLPETIAPKERPSGRFSQKKYRVITLLIIISLLLAFGAVGINFFNYSKKESISFLITHQKCSIYNLNYNKPSEGYTAKIVNEMQKERIDCSQENIDIFYSEARSNNEKLKIRLIAACSKIDEAEYKSCVNYRTLE